MPARTYDEVAAIRMKLDRTQQRFNLKTKRLAADTAYRTSKFLGWLVKEKKIIPNIPVWEKRDRKDGIFSRSDSHWDSKRWVYVFQWKVAPDQRHRAGRTNATVPRLES
jgi:hypothetical protein